MHTAERARLMREMAPMLAARGRPATRSVAGLATVAFVALVGSGVRPDDASDRAFVSARLHQVGSSQTGRGEVFAAHRARFMLASNVH
jgi:hypothetical protein